MVVIRLLPLAAAGLLVVGCSGGTPELGDDPGVADLSEPGSDAARPDLRPPPDLRPVVGPTRLADTGLYSDFGSRTLAENLIHYVPRYELWSDGATKERYLLLPPGQ